jgi:hypothetical protein
MKNFLMIFCLLLLSGFTFTGAQTRTITGTVTSLEGGDPMIGVTVAVKGTTSGTLTDVSGKYSIPIPQGSTTLVFSYIGMKKQEIGIGSSNLVNVILEPDITGLDEVVVTALGISREKNHWDMPPRKSRERNFPKSRQRTS